MRDHLRLSSGNPMGVPMFLYVLFLGLAARRTTPPPLLRFAPAPPQEAGNCGAGQGECLTYPLGGPTRSFGAFVKLTSPLPRTSLGYDIHGKIRDHLRLSSGNPMGLAAEPRPRPALEPKPETQTSLCDGVGWS